MVRTDYCNNLGAAITSRELKPPLVGTYVEIPIAQDHVEYLLFDADVGDPSGHLGHRRLDISFRVHLVLLGHRAWSPLRRGSRSRTA